MTALLLIRSQALPKITMIISVGTTESLLKQPFKITLNLFNLPTGGLVYQRLAHRVPVYHQSFWVQSIFPTNPCLSLRIHSKQWTSRYNRSWQDKHFYLPTPMLLFLSSYTKNLWHLWQIYTLGKLCIQEDTRSKKHEILATKRRPPLTYSDVKNCHPSSYFKYATSKPTWKEVSYK